MSSNFVSVHTDYQNRPYTPKATASRNEGSGKEVFSDLLNKQSQQAAVAGNEQESQAAVYSVCVNWLENRKTMSDRPKISLKPMSIVAGYCVTAS